MADNFRFNQNVFNDKMYMDHFQVTKKSVNQKHFTCTCNGYRTSCSTKFLYNFRQSFLVLYQKLLDKLKNTNKIIDWVTFLKIVTIDNCESIRNVQFDDFLGRNITTYNQEKEPNLNNDVLK